MRLTGSSVDSYWTVESESVPILELLARKDEPLLFRTDSYLAVGLDVVSGVRRLGVQGKRLAGGRLDEVLQASASGQRKVDR